MISSPIKTVQSTLADEGIDSLLIGSSVNIRYLTGYASDFGWLAINPERCVFFTNPLYIEDARHFLNDQYEVIDIGSDFGNALAEIGDGLWGNAIGYESERLICSELHRLQNTFTEKRMVPVVNVVEHIRSIKAPEEIDSISESQRITERVFLDLLDIIREGITEREIAAEVEYRFRRYGGERASFETIVASGPNGSKPHAVPSDRRIQFHDMIVIDMGTVVNGYASDMTRTVSFGTADPEMRNVYETVLEAQMRAIDGIHGGIRCDDADDIARSFIAAAGYGEQFVHSLGHGVGLEVHEQPRISNRSNQTLQSNMVVTVEPGVYIPGLGGVRIEDMVVVRDNDCRNLTTSPKKLIEL